MGSWGIRYSSVIVGSAVEGDTGFCCGRLSSRLLCWKRNSSPLVRLGFDLLDSTIFAHTLRGYPSLPV